jgi:hypothetical protein
MSHRLDSRGDSMIYSRTNRMSRSRANELVVRNVLSAQRQKLVPWGKV